jgi:hypothetical protein
LPQPGVVIIAMLLLVVILGIPRLRRCRNMNPLEK